MERRNKENAFLLKNRRGLSAIVATVIIVGITVAAGAVIWVIVSNLIEENLKEGEACFGIFDQIKLNNDYTCYDSASDKMQFSISVGDIDVNGILVAVSFAGSSKIATLTDAVQNLAYVKNYPDESNGVKMPGKNAVATYFFEGITSMPASISIIPIINEEQCDATDTLYEIDDCLALVS